MKQLLKTFIKRFVHFAKTSRDKEFTIRSKYISKKYLNSGLLQIGLHSYIGRDVKLQGQVTIGNFSSLSDGLTEINAEKSKITIGNYCSIGRNFFPRTSSHFTEALSSSALLLERIAPNKETFITHGEINIGNDVWIGANVTILGCIKVGNGAIIGAGAIVTKDIEPYSINVGIPSKKIGYRFSQELRTLLNSSKWWDLTPEKLIAVDNLIFHNINKLSYQEIKDALDKIQDIRYISPSGQKK